MSFYESRLNDSTSHRPDIITVELLFLKLQYVYHKQHDGEEQFFECLPEILALYVSGRDMLAAMEGLKELLNNDWEFRFTFNYLLRKDIYDDQYPFNELMAKITNFMKKVVRR